MRDPVAPEGTSSPPEPRFGGWSMLVCTALQTWEKEREASRKLVEPVRDGKSAALGQTPATPKAQAPRERPCWGAEEPGEAWQ